MYTFYEIYMDASNFSSYTPTTFIASKGEIDLVQNGVTAETPLLLFW